jgi:hypothetical protein
VRPRPQLGLVPSTALTGRQRELKDMSSLLG